MKEKVKDIVEKELKSAKRDPYHHEGLISDEEIRIARQKNKWWNKRRRA